MTGAPAALPVVLVTVGTDHHRFDRLISWCELWAQANPERGEIVVQHGASRAPNGLSSFERAARAELSQRMEQAHVVVTHGGGGSITQCWQAGAVPIVVPRQHRLGEHVDDHQESFAVRLAEHGYVEIARTYQEFDAAIRNRLAVPRSARIGIDVTRPSETAVQIGAMIDDLIAFRVPKRGHSRR
jgi:UDP-N-acetylglucosamine transferase subunit ALG13